MSDKTMSDRRLALIRQAAAANQAHFEAAFQATLSDFLDSLADDSERFGKVEWEEQGFQFTELQAEAVWDDVLDPMLWEAWKRSVIATVLESKLSRTDGENERD